jgi:cobalt-zinc-cadmium efflux system outer membrane protein
MWGAESADFDEVAADFSRLPAAGTYEQLAPRLASTPGQARVAAQLRWRLAQEKLAQTLSGRGETRWNAGLRRVEVSDDFGFVLGLDYAWPTGTERAHATEARVERARTEAEGAAALLEARSTLFALLQELNHARIEHDAARDEMLPAAEAWLAAVQTGAAAGRYGVRDTLEAQTAVFEARCRGLAAATEYHTTLVAIEQMLGATATP